ncbi:MAG: chemotaxis protein CheX [Chitinophagales bacterium]
MKAEYIACLVNGFVNVTSMMGMSSWQRTGLNKRDKLRTENDVNIIVGLVGGVKGNLVFSMQESTARNIASAMMGGMPVDQFDLMPKSALCELANMSAGNSVSNFEQIGVLLNITPPTLVNGKNIVTMISQVETLVIQLTGNEGSMEIDVALES